MEIDTRIHHILDVIREIRDTNHAFMTYFNGVFRVRIDNIERRAIHMIRHRRGLFNFVGEIGSTLFGIPSPSDLNALKKANELLANVVHGVVNTQRRVVGKVNLLGEKQRRITETLNQVIEGQNYITEAFDSFVSG